MALLRPLPPRRLQLGSVQVEKFSGNLSHGLPKVGRRVVREVL
jgi:hypothetical protein